MDKIKRLIAVGCSITYGQYLDTSDNHGNMGTPSPLAWPQVMADALDCECVNLAWPGANCKYIATRVLEHKWQPGDTCVIFWPQTHRAWIPGYYHEPEQHDDNDVLTWGAGFFCPHQREFTRMLKYRHTTSMDRECEAWLAKHTVKLQLASHGIPSSEFTWSKHAVQYSRFATPWIPVLPGWDKRGFRIDHALDQRHPGPRTQRNIATVFLESLQGPRKNF